MLGADATATTDGPLKGLRVIDAAVLFAGPVIGTLLADFGADVIKVEHPKGDALRTLGWQKDGVSLWWAFVNRNKRLVSIDFGEPEGAELLKELVKDADVLIEIFRPGTFERWGLGPDVLHAINPRLVMVRCSGYGQTGPYSPRPGFGTVAESISGFAHINGHPDGPPTLPPFALGDGVASHVRHLRRRCSRCGIATCTARPARSSTSPSTSRCSGCSAPSRWSTTSSGKVQGRTGSSTDWTAPRNAYQTRDGRWLGLSASSQSIAERVMRLVGHPEVVDEPWFGDHNGRVENQHILDEYIGGWIARARLRRGRWPRSRRQQAVIGPDLLHRGHLQGPAVHRPRHHHHRGRPQARARPASRTRSRAWWTRPAASATWAATWARTTTRSWSGSSAAASDGPRTAARARYRRRTAASRGDRCRGSEHRPGGIAPSRS